MTEEIEPTPEPPTGRPLVVRVAQLSDVGRVRAENQDFAILSAPADEVDRQMGRLLVVADGMGGHRGGATASRMAATIAKDEYFRDGGDISAALTHALERANARIFAESQVNPELRGMGTTCSALVIRGREGWLAHVGDSRIYRVRDGEISQLTDDHSLVASMVREGLLTMQEAEVHPRRNVLQRSMGVGQAVEIDARGPFEVIPGDTFVLCSDGLHGLVKPDEIAKLAQLGIEDAARELVNLALERGAPDNVTVVVGRAEETTAEEIAQWEVAAREERDRVEASFLAPTEEFEVAGQSEITTQRMIVIPADDEIFNAPTEPLPIMNDAPAAAEKPVATEKPVEAPPASRPAAPPARAATPEAPRGGGWMLGVVIVVLLAAALAWIYYGSK
ncbi:MAG: PP2C family serine/threonine-protein phosphatase [Thermoanaerobaculia bacterium]|jgi:protein phosphatase